MAQGAAVNCSPPIPHTRRGRGHPPRQKNAPTPLRSVLGATQARIGISIALIWLKKP